MKIYFFIAFFVSVGIQSLAQNNKLRAEGGVAGGVIAPFGAHKFNEHESDKLWEFASKGGFMTLDCSAGFGSGWKAGLTFLFGSEGLNDSAITKYLVTTIDTAGYFIKQIPSEKSYYSINMFMVHGANDIELGKWTITPQLAVGIATYQLNFSSSYELKQRGSNYWREVTIDTYGMAPGIDFTLMPSLRIGYNIPFKEDRLCIYATGSIARYKGHIGLNYTTEDALDNYDTNMYFTRGFVQFFTLGAGFSYYIMPGDQVSNSSSRIRDRNTRKYKAEDHR